MKCDKLKAEPMIINDDYTALYYPKETVDAAIAELKDKLQASDKQIENFMNSASRIMSEQDKVNDKLVAEIAALKKRK